jgi:hypothetical protein
MTHETVRDIAPELASVSTDTEIGPEMHLGGSPLM